MRKKFTCNDLALIKFSLFLSGEKWLRGRLDISEIKKILLNMNLKENKMKNISKR